MRRVVVILAFMAMAAVPQASDAAHPCTTAPEGTCYHLPDGDRSSETVYRYDPYGHEIWHANPSDTWDSSLNTVLNNTDADLQNVNLERSANVPGVSSCPDPNGPPWNGPVIPQDRYAACAWDFDAFCGNNWEHWSGCNLTWAYLEWNGQQYVDRGHIYGSMTWYDVDSYYPGGSSGEPSEQHAHDPLYRVSYLPQQRTEDICHEWMHGLGFGPHSNNNADCVYTFLCGEWEVGNCQSMFSWHEIGRIEVENVHHDAGWPNRLLAARTPDVHSDAASADRILARRIPKTRSTVKAWRDATMPWRLVRSIRPVIVVDVTGRPDLIPRRPIAGKVFVVRTTEQDHPLPERPDPLTTILRPDAARIFPLSAWKNRSE